MPEIPSNSKMLGAYLTIEKKVERILNDYPYTKGNDKLLIYRFFKVYHRNVKISFRAISDLIELCPSFESITRARRHAQELNPSLRPTTRTQIKRYNRSQAMRDYFANKPESEPLTNYM